MQREGATMSNTSARYETVRSRLAKLILSARSNERYLLLLACLSVVVALGVASMLTTRGISMVRQEMVLDCHYDGNGAHTHNADCYDADGNLVCPLPERELHTHDDSCYADGQTLACGMDEVTEEHVHGAGCFRATTVVDNDEGVTARANVATGALDFTDTLIDEAGCKLLDVRVQAPQGAFPDDTVMLVRAVAANEVMDAVERAVEHEGAGAADVLQSVDISFRDTDGNELQPAHPVEVALEGGFIEGHDDLMVVHVDDAGNADVVSTAAATTASARKDQLVFETNSFSTYSIVVAVFDQLLEASDGQTYRITVDCPEEAQIPADATLQVTELDQSSSDYTTCLDHIGDGLADDEAVDFARLFDISIVANGQKVQPSAPVDVRIQLVDSLEADDQGEVHVAHFGDGDAMPDDVDATVRETADESVVSFSADSFSIYAIVVTRIETKVLASDGNMYRIAVTCGPETGIPRDAYLSVREISGSTREHQSYVYQAEEALGVDSLDYVRLFDINIVDGAGNKVQPAEGTTVAVDIRLDDAGETSDLQVVHFGESAEVLDAQVDGTTLSFDTPGFSVYAIVEAPEPKEVNVRTVTALDELADPEAGFYMSLNSSGTPKYFTSDLNGNSCFIESNDSGSAATWYFEVVNSSAGTYRIYTMVGGVKRYVKNTSGNLVGLADDGSVFQVTKVGDSTFRFKLNGADKWLQHSKSGGGIRFYTDQNNAANCDITLTYASSYTLGFDPYGLNNKTYGIAYQDESVTAVALTPDAKVSGNNQRLDGADMLMRPDVLNNDGVLLVSKDSDITDWTFHCIDENNYQITTKVDGQVKYLTFDGTNVTLEDTPDETKSVFAATPGTGEYSGKWHFTSGGHSLNLAGATSGFNAKTGNDKTTWMNLVERSNMPEEDFNLYKARKVSISDENNVYDGQQVIVYTRIWNEKTLRYEFYAIDHDGSLVRCYDTGDAIEWIGSQVNTAQWEFTEYTNTDGTPNYYYELQNVQYGNYIAPQVTDNQVMSDNTLGINLNGRRFGENYSTIIAWDDDNYAYVGLKVEDGHVVACPLSEADDFYFAVVNPLDPQGELSTVRTIDSKAYGIEMEMVDFNNTYHWGEGGGHGRDAKQKEFFNGDNNNPGVLSTNLGEDGYPTSTQDKTGHVESLGNLFKNGGDGLVPVNHLFIESIYNESGYFEYDSTQNFAHLNENGTFTVYDQLLASGTSSGPTRTHGQFFPYNEIDTNSIATYTNQTDVTAKELPDTDPRKGETLYWLKADDTDYFFGMQMKASFTQTASGLDAWGHDIIFEFSGDDDFWLYVDGELVLDLGGVHSAMTGSVNFRTGVVTSSRGNSTLYDIFKANYQARGMTAAQIDEELDKIFTTNAAGQHVFKDYTNHTMKMFYMERGAGASNLHMRFNLAAVKPGTFNLSKKLSGTDVEASNLLEFPYQIYYTSKADGGETPHLLGQIEGEEQGVLYSGTSTPVTYKPEFMPAGGKEAYDSVFILKPGQKAEVTLPEDAIDYYVVECGVNPDIYDQVKANDDVLTGKDTQNQVDGTARKDFKSSPATTDARPELEFDNHVAEGAMRTLSITKWLYDKDGTTRLSYPDNETLFTFRLYLGSENVDPDKLPTADMYTYYIKDDAGRYCVWDKGQKKFVSLGITNFESLTEEQRSAAGFTTSMTGTISKIPADYTVEVRNLVIGTRFMVEERDYEIPKGYTLRLSDGYTRTDVGTDEDSYQKQYEPISATIVKDNDPEIQVRNQKGWGLTVNKVWTDADFMAQHDPIYFAIYLDGEPMEDSVRQMKPGSTSVYYFFQQLKNDRPFSDYVVREVEVKDPVVDDNGVVTSFTKVTPIEDGTTFEIGGQPVGGEYSDSGYVYTTTYEVGEQTELNENVRTDTVTNSRPGIELYKTDWDGKPISGAVFTLVDEHGNNVAAEKYTSDKTGLITIAYLSKGTYTLTETVAPKGFVVLDNPITITVSEEGDVTVSGVDEDFYNIERVRDGSMKATITIKNRPSSFQARKVDAETGDAIAGVHFALYPQVTAQDGTPRKDYSPKSGYEDLVTDNNGVLPGITMDLPVGTYYLTETEAVDDYALLGSDLCFTLGVDGTVTVNSEEHKSWLKKIPNGDGSVGDGSVSYELAIENQHGESKVSIKKVDIAAPTESALEGAKFDLYEVVDDQQADEPLYADMESNEEGMLVFGGETVFSLPVGTYNLVETKAPAGYILKGAPVVITVTTDDVTYDEGTGLSASNSGKSFDEETKVYTLLVSNSAGVALPHTGGPGVLSLYVAGVALAAVGVVLVMRRRCGQGLA